MKSKQLQKAVFWGCGGEGVYRAAMYYYYQKICCCGYDLNQTKYTKKLEKVGIKVAQENPTDLGNANLLIYSNAIPISYVSKLKKDNTNVKFIALDKFYKKVIKDYENKKLNKSEQKAFIRADIAPLFSLNTKNGIFIGVTGTNGKTTTCEMLYSILENSGNKTCLVSTISAKIGKKNIKTGLHTTAPSNLKLMDLIKKGQKEGCTYYIIEVTSHGLEMQRLAGLKFDYAVYTNVTNEHLDYHKTFKNYLKAKSLLITKHTKPSSKVILNKDDKNPFKYLSKLTTSYITYGIKNSADYQGTNIVTKSNKTTFRYSNKLLKLNILGDYNVYNALAAIAVAKQEQIPLEKIKVGLANLTSVDGRMEVIQNNPFKVIVDFAHTEDALEKSLKYTKSMTDKNLIVVFGCAGGRDKQKRKEMGEVASRYANITILTAEDPRYENLRDINDQIQAGFGKAAKNSLIRFDNDTKNTKVRSLAIKKALELANTGDTVIVCGKGHEESMNFKGVEYKWNDTNEIKKLLKIS